MRRRRGRLAAGAIASAAALTVVWDAAAWAADRIYWADRHGAGFPPVGFANLDGSGGANPAIAGATPGFAEGMAIDAVAGKIYWSNGSINRISFANLDGSGGGGELDTTGATVNAPQGAAVDPVGRRIYWANYSANKISFASLDGGAGGDLNTGSATVSGPISVTIDPAGGRIYWANNSAPKISFASLDGSGGGDIDTTGATVAAAWGMAVDLAAGRVYWGNSNAPVGIFFANLNGTGGGQLVTTGATVNSPAGVAIDVPAGRVYWANGNGVISSASVTGADGRDLSTTGAMIDAANQLAVLRTPGGTGPPVVTGGTARGSTLSCSQGTWAPDLLASAFHQAPQSFAVQWNRDGTDIPGSTANSVVAATAGSYQCRVTASNAAGSASQMSAPHAVVPAFGARTLVTLRLARRRIGAREPLRIRVRNRNDFAIRGRLSGRSRARVEASLVRVVRLRARRVRVPAGRARTVKLRLPHVLRRELVRTGRLRLRLTAKVTDPARATRTIKKRVSPRLKRRAGAAA